MRRPDANDSTGVSASANDPGPWREGSVPAAYVRLLPQDATGGLAVALMGGAPGASLSLLPSAGRLILAPHRAVRALTGSGFQARGISWARKKEQQPGRPHRLLEHR